MRSPSEYAQGRLPGAISFPLFSDEERARVGTCYKQVGREAAVELGFELAGPKFAAFIRQAKELAPERKVRLHCWRGGMRSEAVAWVLQMGGFEVCTLTGGYKAFRRWVRITLATPKPIVVLGGMTGTGKTDILHALAKLGEPVLDLESYANHRGSSYGALGMPPQPSTEQFENLLAMEWAGFDATRPIWLEAESRRIGTCRIADELFQQMEAAPTLAITRPLAERLDYLVKIYGHAKTAGLVEATERIRKRLGGQRTQAAIALIQSGQLHEAFEILLTYYDRAYTYDLERRHQQIPTLDVGGLSAIAAAQKLQTAAKRLFQAKQGWPLPQTSAPQAADTPLSRSN